jgi:hypothetical protein
VQAQRRKKMTLPETIVYHANTRWRLRARRCR